MLKSMKKISAFLLFLSFCLSVQAQEGSAFGVKGGFTIGTQQWNNLDQGPLFTWHGDVYVESLVEGNAFALIAQLGYHNRGSARRNQRIFTQNSDFFTINQSFEFNNISLMLGAKQKYDLNTNSKFYYLIGNFKSEDKAKMFLKSSAKLVYPDAYVVYLDGEDLKVID